MKNLVMVKGSELVPDGEYRDVLVLKAGAKYKGTVLDRGSMITFVLPLKLEPYANWGVGASNPTSLGTFTMQVSPHAEAVKRNLMIIGSYQNADGDLIVHAHALQTIQLTPDMPIVEVRFFDGGVRFHGFTETGAKKGKRK